MDLTDLPSTLCISPGIEHIFQHPRIQAFFYGRQLEALSEPFPPAKEEVGGDSPDLLTLLSFLLDRLGQPLISYCICKWYSLYCLRAESLQVSLFPALKADRTPPLIL